MNCPLYYTKTPDYSEISEIFLPCDSIIEFGKKPKKIELGITNFSQKSFAISFKRPPDDEGRIATLCLHGYRIQLEPPPAVIYFINRCGLHDFRRFDPSHPVTELGNCRDNLGNNTSEDFGGTLEDPCLNTINIEYFIKAFNGGNLIFQDSGDFIEYYFDTSGYNPPGNTINCGDCDLNCDLIYGHLIEIKNTLQGI
ncbi:hypothetical protein WJM97_22305 [Okeanomitos corallinicola TIOX110]|uniref:Uncharacterized protein n=1 Tax=Okeanomitos corallinicola TIOX110 TaxID=3133117 RepID=A0ABZ2UXD3_9CYAN